jgi:hypothetical protein
MTVRYASEITFRHSNEDGWSVGYEDENGEFNCLSGGHATRQKAADSIFEAWARQRKEAREKPDLGDA